MDATALPTFALFENARDFCTLDDLAQSLEYVNQFLGSYGLGSSLNLGRLDKEDQLHVINTIFALIKQKQDDLKQHHDNQELIQQQQTELETLHLRLAKTEKSMIEAEREVDLLRSRLSTSEATLRSTSTLLKETKAELQKTIVKSQSRHAQYTVDLRKKEREFTKLQDRLTKYSMDRSAGKTNIRLLNPIKTKPTSLQRSASDQDDEAIRLVTIVYQEREKVLMEENSSLRQTLLALQRKMENLVDLGESTKNEDDVNELDVLQLRLPFDLVKGTVQENTASLVLQLQYHMDILRGELEEKTAHLQQSSFAVVTPPSASRTHEMETQRVLELQAEISDLRIQINEQQNVIAEQERYLQLALETSTNTAMDSLDISGIEVTSAELAEQRAVLERQRRQLEEERKALTAAAIDIGRDREKTQREQQEAEYSRRQAETQRIFDAFPPTPEWLHSPNKTAAMRTPTTKLPSKSQLFTPSTLKFEDDA